LLPDSIPFVSHVPFPEYRHGKRVGYNFVVHKKYLPDITAFFHRIALENGLLHIELEAYDLKSLYAYCPFIEEQRMMIEELIAIEKQGDYPCADSAKLRPEHRPKAVLFELPEKRGEK
jgi:hypothetical protein